MQLFLQVVLAYPTLPLSIVLTVCLLYWLLVAGGLLGDGLGLGLEAGDGLELDAGAHGLAAMLARFGLGGAPLMLVLSLLTFFAWTLVYLLQLLVEPRLEVLVEIDEQSQGGGPGDGGLVALVEVMARKELHTTTADTFFGDACHSGFLLC